MTKDQKMLILTIFLGILAFLFFTINRGVPTQKLSPFKAKPGEKLSQKASSDTIPSVEELIIEDLVVGEGIEAVAGNTITVNYAGTLLDGTKFDSSYDRGVPFTFTLGAGEVIAGWDQGFTGMKVGGKRKLIIPASLGYGEQGAGALIPPNSTLVFEVELLEVK